MPRRPRHALIWSTERQQYELYAHGQLERLFGPLDEAEWLKSVADRRSFAFHGRSGQLNLLKEARARGEGYWYAYHYSAGKSSKRYLGATQNILFGRLEETAQSLGATTTGQRALTQDPAAPSTQPQDSTTGNSTSLPLLAAKLLRPRLPAALVERERLLRLMDGALQHPLLLVSAAAGWGKTTLLSAWASSLPYPVAWVSLDALDNDPRRFWATVIATLQRFLPTIGAVPLAMLNSPEPPPSTVILTVLLNELALHDAKPLVLVLDDFHVIEDEQIHQALLFLLEHNASGLHIVLASRIDPDLPLPRLRVRGQVAEIRAADLRFSPQETALFLDHAVGPGLAESEVLLLAERSEGWVAALQLAALSLRSRGQRGLDGEQAELIKGFTGTQHYLIDYMRDEVLRRQPAAVQRFLSRISVVSRLNASLCAALLATKLAGEEEPLAVGECQEMLEWLERHNLFLVALDEERRWYRLHDLFREVLLAQQQLATPELLPRLHERAAHWYAGAGELREAITHALAAAQFDYAVSLIKEGFQRFWLDGEARTILGWISLLPDEVLRAEAPLVLDAALLLLGSAHTGTQATFNSASKGVEALLARLDKPTGSATADRNSTSSGEQALITRRSTLLRLYIASRGVLMANDAEQLAGLAARTMALAGAEEPRWKIAAWSINFWLVEPLRRDGALLIPDLLLLKQQVIAAGDRYATERVLSWLCFGYLRAARPDLLEREVRQALALLQQAGERSTLEAYFYYYIGASYCDQNRLAEASDIFQRVLQIAQTWQMADMMITGRVYMAWIKLTLGDLVAAGGELAAVEELLAQERFAAHRGVITALRVQYWLVAGMLDEAGRWADEASFSHENWDANRADELLMLVRVYRAQGKLTLAHDTLAQFGSRLDRPGNPILATSYLALRAALLHANKQQQEARATAARLLALAEPGGVLVPFIEECEAIWPVLLSLLENAPADPGYSKAFLRRVLGVFEQQARSQSVTATASHPAILVEPLTEREVAVLQQLAAGASNNEIAAQLVIALPTVKKHVSNILGKLGVETRARATARARELGLL